jgi:hypothetical protein
MAQDHPKSEHPKSEHPKSEHPKGEHPKGEHPKSEHPAEHGQEAGPLAQLQTNDGAKWELDELTRRIFRQASESLSRDNLTDLSACHALAGELKTGISELIAGCTMQGAAHDQLHHFLNAYIPAVNELQGSTALDPAQKVVSELRAQLKTFNQFFQ